MARPAQHDTSTRWRGHNRHELRDPMAFVFVTPRHYGLSAEPNTSPTPIRVVPARWHGDDTMGCLCQTIPSHWRGGRGGLRAAGGEEDETDAPFYVAPPEGRKRKPTCLVTRSVSLCVCMARRSEKDQDGMQGGRKGHRGVTSAPLPQRHGCQTDASMRGEVVAVVVVAAAA